MAKSKGRSRDRDKPEAIRKLISTFGNILETEGPTGLVKKKISKQAGRKEVMIDRYFEDLNGLHRAYVREQDYWIPIFERFQLGENPGIDDIREVFSTIMLENFKFFSTNVDMQNIILWQISEVNALMTEISEDRERKGELLFGKTDAAFSASAVNFRAVNALLLGGIYYIVLHARHNMSKVCGIDISSEADQMEVIRTNDQVLSWACNAVKSGYGEFVVSDADPFDQLEDIVARLVDSRSSVIGSAPDLVFKYRLSVLGKCIVTHSESLTSKVQIATYLSVTLNRLSRVCDELFDGGSSLNPDADMVIGLFTRLLADFSDLVPVTVCLPKLFSRRLSAELNLQWQEIKSRLENNATDPFMIDIVSYPFIRFIQGKCQLFWSDHLYLCRYSSVLLSGTVMGSAFSLDELLIGLNYNHTSFVSEFILVLKKRLSVLRDDALCLELLIETGRMVTRAQKLNALSFDRTNEPVARDLLSFIESEMPQGSTSLPK